MTLRRFLTLHPTGDFMVTLSYVVFGALLGALLFGGLGVWYARRLEALHLAAHNDAARTARESKRLTVDALNAAHVKNAAYHARAHAALFSRLEASEVAADMANASNEAYTLEVLAFRNSAKSYEATIAAQNNTIAELRTYSGRLLAQVADLGPKAVKRETWKRDRRADRRALSALAHDVASVTERDQKIAGLQAEAFDTSETLDAVELQLEEVRRLAAMGGEDARDKHLGQWAALRMFEDIAAAAGQ